MKMRLAVCDAESLGEKFSTFRRSLLPWSSWSGGVRRTFLWNHSPHTTRRHIPKMLTLHTHHRCHNHTPHNIEHSLSLALRTEVRSRNSNTPHRWRPVDCRYVRPVGTAIVYVWLSIAWKTHCGFFAVIVRIGVIYFLYLHYVSGRFPRKVGTFLRNCTVPCLWRRPLTLSKSKMMHTFLDHLCQLNYPPHVSNKQLLIIRSSV